MSDDEVHSEVISDLKYLRHEITTNGMYATGKDENGRIWLLVRARNTANIAKLVEMAKFAGDEQEAHE